jgi:hypothetical protein
LDGSRLSPACGRVGRDDSSYFPVFTGLSFAISSATASLI